jgi:hypothetical protein
VDQCEYATDIVFRQQADLQAIYENLARAELRRKRISLDGLAQRENRIASLKARAAALRGLIRARGQSNAMKDAPGFTDILLGILERPHAKRATRDYSPKKHELS